MALSNLRKEPRREITEHVLGLVVGGGVLWLDYFVCSHAETKYTADFVFIMFILPIFALLVLFLVGMVLGPLVHLVGELVCDGLAKLGLDPRPKDRYR